MAHRQSAERQQVFASNLGREHRYDICSITYALLSWKPSDLAYEVGKSVDFGGNPGSTSFRVLNVDGTVATNFTEML